MPTYTLRDVDVTAISLVKSGANGQRIFLCKEDAEKPQLPSQARLIAKADWSAMYVVVAEPGTPENGGVLAPDATDVWTKEEILKAAHKFMENGATIAKGHDEFLNGDEVQPYGQLVENAVALADIPVPQPDGTVSVIKEGSWYIAIKPTEEGKAAYEAGELGGVSIQGDAMRLEVAKQEKGLLAKIAAHLGITADDEPAPVAKAVDDFATRQFRTEASWDLSDAIWTLEDVIWSALHREDVDDPAALILQSIDQFRAWAASKLAEWPTGAEAVAKRQELAKRLPPGVTLPADDPVITSEDDMDQATRDEIKATVDAAVAPVSEAVAAIAKSVETLTERVPEPEPKAPTPEELKEQIEGVATSVAAIAKSVENLGEGGSGQSPEHDRTEAEREALAKRHPHYIGGLL